MADLRKRFGALVAVHRRRLGLSQDALAEAAGISTNMVAKIEIGATGARFPMIERLAGALKVDPAELFSPDIPNGALAQSAYADTSARLIGLSKAEHVWVQGILDAILRDH